MYVYVNVCRNGNITHHVYIDVYTYLDRCIAAGGCLLDMRDVDSTLLNMGHHGVSYESRKGK